MCSEFAIKTRLENINAALDEALENKTGETVWEMRVKISQKAPVIEMLATGAQEKAQLVPAIFPVQPFPNSRLSGIEDEGAAHAAPADDRQIKRIYERPTWKKGFEEHRCLIPLTSFFEPVYWGEDAGRVMEFTPTEDEILFVAGIKIKPRLPATNALNAFSMLTHTPTPQMLKYHHRMLVFLKPQQAYAWISGGKADAREKFDELIENRYIPKLAVTKDRQMAKGWEKRVEQHAHKLNSEKEYLSVLKEESIRG